MGASANFAVSIALGAVGLVLLLGLYNMMRGGSAIVNPLGQVLAGPHFDGETILTADLDLADIGRGKFDFDVVGHYARPDVFRLVVNEAPLVPVTRLGAD